jgi:hypothetical protein
MPLGSTLLTLPALLIVAACAHGQHMPERAGTHDHDAGGHSPAAAAHEAMTHTIDAMPAREMSHLVMTPRWPTRTGDEARAAHVVAELRRGLAKYADYRAALADGYEPFLPDVPQEVYHFTSTRRAILEAFGFDPAIPSSLLYEKTADGYRLVGAMYNAPRRLSLEELDQRVPLSVTRWHRHVDLCVPRQGDAARWREVKDGAPLFGPEGSITTREACDAASGRFIPNLFGWMVHVHPFEHDPGKVWGSEHDHHGGMMGAAHGQ